MRIAPQTGIEEMVAPTGESSETGSPSEAPGDVFGVLFHEALEDIEAAESGTEPDLAPDGAFQDAPDELADDSGREATADLLLYPNRPSPLSPLSPPESPEPEAVAASAARGFAQPGAEPVEEAVAPESALRPGPPLARTLSVRTPEGQARAEDSATRPSAEPGRENETSAAGDASRIATRDAALQATVASGPAEPLRRPASESRTPRARDLGTSEPSSASSPASVSTTRLILEAETPAVRDAATPRDALPRTALSSDTREPAVDGADRGRGRREEPGSAPFDRELFDRARGGAERPASGAAIDAASGTSPAPSSAPAAATPALPLVAAVGPSAAPPTPSTAAAGAAQPVDAVPQQIEFLANGGGGTARIRLHPERLGELEIRVVTRGNTVEVVVRAEEPAAQAAVLAQREQLVDSLASRELRMESFDVLGGGRDAAQREGTAFQGSRQGPFAGDARDERGGGTDSASSGNADRAAVPPTTQPPTTAGIDLRI